MARRRFFVDAVTNSQAEITGEDAEHLTRVLRAQIGQQFEISDNQTLYLAEISQIAKQRVSLRILETLPFELSPVRLILLVALIKFDRFEWMIEKATELGVDVIVPVNAERSEKGLLQAAQKRAARWSRIARESSQQARRMRLPEIQAAREFDTVVASASSHRYFLDERPETKPALPGFETNAPGTISLMIGPEGGWTDREREQFMTHGWVPVSLGPSILRTETATIAALAVFGHAARVAYGKP